MGESSVEEDKAAAASSGKAIGEEAREREFFRSKSTRRSPLLACKRFGSPFTVISMTWSLQKP